MKKLGIIGAMTVEVELLTQRLKAPKTEKHAGMDFYEGELEGLPCVIVQCGVGKVNAGICSQILVDCFHVTHIVNTGVAGSLDARLDIGDFVISENAMYHDFTCGFLGYPVGQVPGLPVREFAADPIMMKIAVLAAETVNPGHYAIGTVASGDQFVCSKEQKEQIIADTKALCTEMEGAAIAHAAWRNGIPFLILRAISDKADDSAEMDFPTFEAIAAKKCAAFTQTFAKELLGA